MFRINIIGQSNGVGLTRDINLLLDVLVNAGFDARAVLLGEKHGRRRRSRWLQVLSKIRILFKVIFSKREVTDINILLEHIWHEQLPGAKINIAMPNPEWFDKHDMRFIENISGVWAKTENTKKIFSDIGCKVYGTGFLSEDRWIPFERKEKQFLHVAGKSVMKGTRELLQCWVAHPEWPKLIVLKDGGKKEEFEADNIEYISGHLEDEQLKILQNKSLFHVCPSQTEGWGHYIVEAISCGAIVLTLDAPPMNELVSAECGLLISSFFLKEQKLASCYTFNEAALAKSVDIALGLNCGDLEIRSAVSRSHYLSIKSAFIASFRAYVGAQGGGEARVSKPL